MLVGVPRKKGVEYGAFCVVSRQEFVLDEYGEVVMEKKRDCRNPSTHKEYIIIIIIIIISSSSKKNHDYDYDIDYQ